MRKIVKIILVAAALALDSSVVCAQTAKPGDNSNNQKNNNKDDDSNKDNKPDNSLPPSDIFGTDKNDTTAVKNNKRNKKSVK